MSIISLIIPLGFILIIISIVIYYSSTQEKSKGDNLIKFKNYELEGISIRFLRSYVGKASMVGGIPIKAQMYMTDNFILITPRKKGNFDGMNAPNVLAAFAKDENIMNELSLNNVVIPDSLKTTSWNSIVIKYQGVLVGKVKYTVQINLLDKKDSEKLNLLKNWC
ncbi:hypothetical protein [Maribellus sediminis]|uniref:hypothetical protein n=1 Tax=Maribellus sediminis TaxID=2696285 RepID=UPI001430601B|nr:hypothetical protein [Maribellus sediminis]